MIVATTKSNRNRFHLPGLLCGAILTLSGQARAEEGPRLVPIPWYVLSLEGGGLGVRVDDTIVFSSVQPNAAGKHEFWIVERRDARTSLGSRSSTHAHQWIDGRKCPAVADVLARMPASTALRFSSAGANVRIAPPSDIARLRLSAPAAGDAGHGGARVSISEYFGVFANWWGKSLGRLEACWTDQPVALGDAPVSVLLATPDDAARWKAF